MKKHAPTQPYALTRWQAGEVSQASDDLAEEVPIALVYNGISHAVMLATPQDLQDFALGFSLTEGILQDKSELYGVEVVTEALDSEVGITLQLDIATERFAALKAQRRSMAGRTGCGLCGAESLAQVFRLPKNATYLQTTKQLQASSIIKAQTAMKAMQPMRQATGATHACAWADLHGNIVLVREDVGRHNALDKLLGSLSKQSVTGGFILTSSRASYEMVQKTVMAGFDVLAAVSAPTGLAVRIAEEYGMTLLGFVRDNQLVAYTHANRLLETG